MSNSSDSDELDPQLWKNTTLYLARSSNGFGWGVYAGRDFAKGDIVELAPMFVRLDLEENRPAVLKETVLNNYHYEYWGWDAIACKCNLHCMISFGYTLYYNHSTSHHNIEHRKFGTEPDLNNLDSAAAVGYFALRDICRGEELLTDYGGQEWFQSRGITLIEEKKQEQISGPAAAEAAPNPESRPKVYGGPNRIAFQRVTDSHEEDVEDPPYRMESIIPFLPPGNIPTGFGNTIAKEPIGVGETVEYVPILLLPTNLVQGTLLQSLALSWSDLEAGEVPTNAFKDGVYLQYQQDGDHNVSSTMVKADAQNCSLLPLAGSITLMARDLELANARLDIEVDPYNEESICARVVALQPIPFGEPVVLRLPPNDTSEAIVQELALTGQPISDRQKT